MNKRLIRKFLLVVLTFLTLVFMSINGFAEQSQNRKTILVLHSYNEGLAWTSEQNSGIIENLVKEHPNCSINVEYMDWKSYPTIKNLNQLFDYYKYKYQNKQLDLIITTDDAAFTFALENREHIFSDAPIVFSGVNQDSISKIKGKYKNFTGAIEEIDPTETIKMALNINPALENVYVIFDNSESGISGGKLVIDKVESMNLNIKAKPLNNLQFDELLKFISKLDEKSIVFVSSYFSDVTGSILGFNYAAKKISKYSSVPVYHQFDFGLNNGALGGDMLSGRISGNFAASLALRILKGEAADNIPVFTPKMSRKVFDYEQLKRFNISTSKLPKDVEIINKPFSFCETYKTLVIGVLLAFAIMLTFLVTLLMYLKRIRKVEKELSNSNEELTQTYEELLATDEELKNHIEEITTIQKDLYASEEKYTYLAFHDVLTGLPNRRSMFEAANKIFTNNTQNKAALLFIDMDNFKFINDTMGHEFGDELIKKASERLTLELNDKTTLYRFGGDEFIFLIDDISDQSEVEKFTNHILFRFKEEFIIDTCTLHISFSIGLALYPEHGDNIEELIKSADIAMYKAKEDGRNRYVLYEDSLNEAFVERMNLEKLMHNAMDKDEFELYFQPQLDLNSNRITGLEALLRWKSPELGFVSPLKFIKVAEETHLIIQLGEWVLVKACDFISRLHKRGYTDLTVSVNISTLQILQADFSEKIIKMLEFFKLAPSSLELEITETVLIESFDSVYKKLKLLSEYGIGIALDDFGKGYSSLNYLKQLPISTLKIDKCFIDNLSISGENKTITRYIINMGRSMGMSVIAEGVELEEQMEYLKKYQCDKIQGYLFAKPLPQNDIEQLLESDYNTYF